jgi:hypothetical protein
MKTLARIAAVLVVALLVPFLHTSPASAAQYAQLSGRPGSVSLNGPMLTGYDMRTRLSNGTYVFSKSWEASGFTVGRSPAYTGTQDVVGIYVLQRYINGTWTAWVSQNYSGRVSGTGTLRFPAWVHHPTNVPSYRQSYRVAYVVAWYVAGTSQNLATVTITPSTTADNRCHTVFGFFRCDAYWDGIVF